MWVKCLPLSYKWKKRESQAKTGKRERKEGDKRAGGKPATNHFQIPSNIMSVFLEPRLCNANDIMPITLSDFTQSCRKSEQDLLIQKMERREAGFQDSPAFHFSPQCEGSKNCKKFSQPGAGVS